MKKKIIWTVGVIVVLYAALFIGRFIHAIGQQQTDAAVAQIHATKLTLDDVMGKNLPAAFTGDTMASQGYYNATVQGVDANKNGIRDDVELAIFKAYPNSAKTRAVLLQYALALQMEVTQAIVNGDTVTAVAEDGERAYSCVGKILSRNDLAKYIQDSNRLRTFVEAKQLNTEARKKARDSFYGRLQSHTSPNDSCDINLDSLSN